MSSIYAHKVYRVLRYLFVKFLQRGDCMPRSEAQKRADKKYIAKTYKRYAINTRLEYVPTIEKYMSEHNFTSSSSFFNSAIKYIIENNINLNGLKDNDNE